MLTRDWREEIIYQCCIYGFYESRKYTYRVDTTNGALRLLRLSLDLLDTLGAYASWEEV